MPSFAAGRCAGSTRASRRWATRSAFASANVVVGLQRKNALFSGHALGAENWAAIASLVETCKLNAINPGAYLADVLARVVTRHDGDPIDDLLPGNWIDTKAAQPTFETNDIALATAATA